MSPLNLKEALLEKHAQHVVLVHFPIALFIVGVAFDFLARWRKQLNLAAAAYYNFCGCVVDTPRHRDRPTRLAVPTRSAKTKRHFIAAPRVRRCSECNDMAGLVCTFPSAPLVGNNPAILLSSHGSSCYCSRSSHRTLGGLP